MDFIRSALRQRDTVSGTSSGNMDLRRIKSDGHDQKFGWHLRKPMRISGETFI